MIEFKNISFRYEDDAADTLKNISFHVKQGEWVSIVGRNGSGKSTTARLIDGLLEAHSGQILINQDILTADNVWEKRKMIGMVFQNPDNQFVGATVEDDVAFGLENQGLPIEEMQARVKESLQQVNMLDYRDREPSRLSGGQKQRVAIAGVIALRPSILILDEATSMLDPEGRKDLIQLVRKVKDQYQMTVVSITHDLDEISLSDRVIVLKDGQIESTSRPDQLFSRDDLALLGLSQPFTNRVKQALVELGWEVPSQYLSESELEEMIWELSLKM